MRSLSLIFILLFIFSKSNAATPECLPLSPKIENKNIILPGTEDPKNSVVYFFKNKSLQSVLIDHPLKNNPGMNAGWSSYLRPDHWSALVLNKKEFAVSCVMIQPGKVVTLDCSTIIDVCTPHIISSKTPLKGNYWLSEDKPWDGFLKTMEKRGVTFTPEIPAR
jgi:hypothetical protein